MNEQPVRWGIMSTANIARSSFLPALRAAGGRPYAVAGRNLGRSQEYADANGIERALEGYERLIEDPDVEAIYIALPNSLHAEWTIASLRAGKAVLCEKPLCTSVAETEAVLAVARETGSLLWEAFVFPFQHQMARVRQVIAGGTIGEPVEIQSNFHFRLRNRENIRLSPALAGGSLNDVGCYCIRLAGLIFAADPVAAVAMARWAPEGVDEEMQGVLDHGNDRRLVFSCGMSRPRDVFSRIVGTEGEIRLSDPFHPQAGDTIDVRQADASTVEPSGQEEPSFTPAIRSIGAAIRGQAPPEHLAVDEAMGTALGLHLAAASARSNAG